MRAPFIEKLPREHSDHVDLPFSAGRLRSFRIRGRNGDVSVTFAIAFVISDRTE